MRDALAEARTRLAQVYMEEYADRYPAELSDGMRKRAAIARTLALGPEVVLFDEPTTGLDPVSARRIDRLIRELADKLGVTAIVVSHDPPSIFGIADRVAFLYQGIVHVVATPAELRASERSDRPAVHHRPVERADGDARLLNAYLTTPGPFAPPERVGPCIPP